MHKIDFATAYQSNYHTVFAFVRSHISQLETAQDITSNIFLAAYRNWDKFDPGRSSVSTWLYCIASNQLKNYYRDRKDQVSLEGLEEEGTVGLLVDPGRPYELMELREVLAQALERLPERSRNIVILRYFAGKDHREISEIMGISYENTRVILTRALKELKKMLICDGIRMEE